MIFTVLLSLLFASVPLEFSTKITPNPRIEYLEKGLLKAGLPPEKIIAMFYTRRLSVINLNSKAKHGSFKDLENEIMTFGSIARGWAYKFQNREVLDRLYREQGILPEDLVALVRMESNLGTYLGEYTAADVVYTQLVKSKQRSWQSHAKDFILLVKYSRQAKIDLFTIKSSYAAAIGLVQFIPPTWEWCGVDGDGDGIVNLLNPADALASAAKYLLASGYRKNRQEAFKRYLGSKSDKINSRYAEIILKYSAKLRSGIHIK